MTAPVPATAASTVGLRTLPVDADDGFPQSFLLGMAERTYRFELYVDVPEHLLNQEADRRTTIDVVGSATSPAQGMLVGVAVRQSPDGTPVPLLRRRFLPGLVHTAAELVLVVDEVRIAVGNLNGAGAFGSVLRARVGVR
ncbi:hypothetical protein [Cellulomonas fengjieae]|uniref:hypothetical protein n=1 Tax=Cellulomonas fengjieae TaxID=2819978 RepID=UPI001AAF31C8|nr:hypothetical protein [Cellulomonas fengjieae]MBO3103830.1 hypothetical protein [Cellulomonas fengjieae]